MSRPTPKRRTDIRILIYTAYQVVVAPVAALRQLARFANPRLHHRWVPEAWSTPPPTPPGRSDAGSVHVVFVGPTIGEFRMMAALGDELVRRHPQVRVTYCLRDSGSLARIRAERPEVSLGYRPVDFLPIAARWTRRFRPDLVVFMEGMRFPALAWAARASGSSVALANGRASSRERWHHRLRAPIFRWLFEPFDLLMYPSEAPRRAAERWTHPHQRLCVVGDLKAASLPAAPRPETLESLSVWLLPSLATPLLAAGSTDGPGEEKMVLDAFLAVRQIRPCQLLVAPRLPERAAVVASEARARGLRVSLRSDPVPEADVFVLDTVGELYAAYSFCEAAYVGGALNGKGHNVLEPVAWSIPAAYGPRRGAFEAAQLLCEEHGVGTRVRDAAELARTWRRALEDEAYRLEVRAAAQRVLEDRSGPLERTVQELGRLVDAQSVRTEKI